LVIYGDKDNLTGPPEPLVAIIRRGLEVAGNRAVRVEIFPGADHRLCRAEPRSGKESQDRSATKGERAASDFVPGYLALMTTWLGEILR
jgi:hypothetical protein